MRQVWWCCLSMVLLATPVAAAEQPTVEELRQQLEALKRDYQQRVEVLEARIHSLEVAQTEAVPPAAAEQSRPNVFNPAIGVVLQGTLSTFAGTEAPVPGFMVGEEADPGEEGFSLGESELNANVNVDDKFFGNLTLALEDSGDGTEVSLEEAWIQTLALPFGLTVRGGRFFSGIGYRNEFHLHADDFVDRPLPYRAFLERQYKDDGVQLRWLAPTDRFLELGAEWMRGAAFPAAGAAHSGTGAWSLFARTGGDMGASHAWQAGLGYLRAQARDRATGPEDSPDRFSGQTDVAIADLVWKWAPNGNPYRRNFKFETAFLWQNPDGAFTPGDQAEALPLDVRQWGGYAEAVYQFMPRWRAGLRYAWLDAGNPGTGFAGTSLDPQGHDPRILTTMLDWSNSEFSRLRLQYSRDDSAPTAVDRVWLQYQMSLGAHGAHQF